MLHEGRDFVYGDDKKAHYSDAYVASRIGTDSGKGTDHVGSSDDIAPSGTSIAQSNSAAKHEQTQADKALGQVALGRYYQGEITLTGTLGEIALSLTGADVVFDLRDLSADLRDWEWSWKHAGETFLDAVGLIPVIGTIKHVDEIGEVITLMAKNGDELVEVGQVVAKNADEAGAIIRSAAKTWDGKTVEELAELHISSSGKTVLGHYAPGGGYIGKAQSMGASYFDIGGTWEKLSETERWAANRHFLDVIAERGDRVCLSVSQYDIRPNSSLVKELDYLIKQKGYRWVDEWSLAKEVVD